MAKLRGGKGPENFGAFTKTMRCDACGFLSVVGVEWRLVQCFGCKLEGGTFTMQQRPPYEIAVYEDTARERDRLKVSYAAALEVNNVGGMHVYSMLLDRLNERLEMYAKRLPAGYQIK